MLETLSTIPRPTAASHITETLTTLTKYIPRLNVLENLRTSTISSVVVTTVSEALSAVPRHVASIHASESLSSLEPLSNSVRMYVSETLVAVDLSRRVHVHTSESLTTVPKHVASISISETLTYDVPRPTPTQTPIPPPVPPRVNVTPVPVVNGTLPSIFRDRELCVLVREHSRTVNGIKVFDIDGDPKIVVTNTTKTSSVSILPSSDVWGTYPLVCKDYYYCGYRTYVLVSCALRTCAVSVNAPNNYNWYAAYSDLLEFSISISSKIESVFGSGFVVYYVNIYYKMSDGYAASFNLPVWSWFFGASTEPRSPYPVEVWVTGEASVLNCGKGGLSELCPWRGAWHSMFSCALWDVFRWLSTALASLIPQPVKDFFSLIWGMLSLVGVALSFLVNPSFLLMLFTLFSMIVVLYIIHVFLEKGPSGVIEIYETLKSLVESIVDSVLKFVNTIKP